MSLKHIYIETYGCSANQNNAEILAGLLCQAGLDIVTRAELADMVVLNTCVVKGPTEERMWHRLKQLQKSRKPVIVSGCMPEVRRIELEKISKLENKKIYLLGIHHTKEICKLIKRIQEGRYNASEFLTDKKEIKVGCAKISKNKVIGITQISEGCLGNCAFCITKLAKGSLFSYPQDEILKNIKQDLELQGCKEIWLTSQDNAAYGLDRNKEKRDRKSELIELLYEIIKIKKKFFIRLGMMNPENALPILDELIEIYKDEKMYKFLHIPLQSGSDKILKSMNRRYKVEDFLEIINRFKKEIKNITVSTDIIVSYPGESEEDFEKTVEIIKKIKPDVLNISKFWPRQGTEAAKLPVQDVDTAKQRATQLMKLHMSIALENNKKWLGWQGKCLVNQHGFQNTWLARNNAYKLIVLRAKNNENLLGKFVNVKINRAMPHYLYGEML